MTKTKTKTKTIIVSPDGRCPLLLVFVLNHARRRRRGRADLLRGQRDVVLRQAVRLQPLPAGAAARLDLLPAHVDPSRRGAPVDCLHRRRVGDLLGERALKRRPRHQRGSELRAEGRRRERVPLRGGTPRGGAPSVHRRPVLERARAAKKAAQDE